MALAQSELPDLILLDWEMPQMKGIDVLRLLKAKEPTAAIPVIMATAVTASENLCEALEAGAVDYVRKPFDKTELLARTRSTIKLNSYFRETERQKTEIEAQNHIILQQNHKLKKSEERLQKLNKLKDKLFSVISHDIKGPVNSLIMLVGTLQKQADSFSPEEISMLFGEVKKNLGSVTFLLDNLLAWSLSQMELNMPMPDVFPVKASITQNINLLLASAKAKNIRLVFHAEGVGFQVFADKDMLDFTLRNLISNAIKFTAPGGSINISATVFGTALLRVSVSDSGIGIPEERLSKLFASGRLNSTYGTNNEKGTGLGLPLCKEFAVKNGGDIWAESAPGKGSVFHFTVPLSVKSETHRL